MWFINLVRNCISLFPDLINSFKIQFASSRRISKHTSDLHRVKIKHNVSLGECFGRFTHEKIFIVECEDNMAIEAFRMGLRRGTPLYKELTMYSC